MSIRKANAVSDSVTSISKKDCYHCQRGRADSTVSQLSTSSEAIGALIKVINSTAEQTNLLALNATIEAARACEARKGFAVRRCGQSSHTVASGSSAISTDVSELVDGTNDTSEAVNVVKQEIRCLTKVATDLQAMADNFHLNNELAIQAVEKRPKLRQAVCTAAPHADQQAAYLRLSFQKKRVD